MNGKNILIERRRVKHARITVSRQKQVRMVVPQQFSERQIRDLIEEKSAWITKQLKHFSRVQEARIPLAKDEILYRGVVYRFQFREELGGRVVVDSAKAVISSGVHLLKKPLLEIWYRFEARQLISMKALAYSRQYGFKFKGLAIRGQKTRWGSCSNRGNLSFNWKLILAPDPIIDYIILHELVHTKVLNHSPEYWARLATLYPHHHQAKNWLKANSWLLD